MKLTKKQRESLEWVIFWAVVILIVAVIFGGAYLIANSNLPDWFKFWLLK